MNELKIYQDKVTFPLNPIIMKDFFQDKSQVFEVDYSKCEIKGNMFITYLSNLGLSAEVDFEGAGSDAKLELLKEYMQSRHIANCKTLDLMILKILIQHKTQMKELGLVDEIIITDKEADNFIQSNTDLVQRWILFLDSVMIYGFSCFEELKDTINPEKIFSVVDDQNFIGLNVVNLFSVESFFEVYYSLPLGEVKYFQKQFNDYMFNGKNLFYYFQTQENFILKLLTGLLNDQIAFKEVTLAFE